MLDTFAFILLTPTLDTVAFTLRTPTLDTVAFTNSTPMVDGFSYTVTHTYSWPQHVFCAYKVRINFSIVFMLLPAQIIDSFFLVQQAQVNWFLSWYKRLASCVTVARSYRIDVDGSLWRITGERVDNMNKFSVWNEHRKCFVTVNE